MNRSTSTAGRRAICRASAMVMVFAAAGCGAGGVGPASVAGQTPDARVEMRQVQAAAIASGGGGSGTLHYRGQNYPFTVAGGGVGGFGASTIEAEGEVYNLRNPRDFAGTYVQARYGGAVGTTSAGELWLQNGAGVIMHLRARRTGLILSLGGDAVVVTMAP